MSESTILPAPTIEDPSEPKSKWDRERQAFLRLLPQLLQTHADLYVAVHDGQVVDSDKDKIALAQRVYAKFGYIPIYVGLVSVNPPVVRMPSIRVV